MTTQEDKYIKAFADERKRKRRNYARLFNTFRLYMRQTHREIWEESWIYAKAHTTFKKASLATIKLIKEAKEKQPTKYPK